MLKERTLNRSIIVAAKSEKDRFYLFMVALSFLYFSISNISRMLGLIGIPREIPYAIFIVVFAIFFLITIKRIRIFDIVYYFVVGAIVFVGLYKYGAIISSRTNFYAILLLFLPAYFFFRFIDYRALKVGLKISSYYSIVYVLIYYFLVVRVSNAYDMDYSNWISIPICVLFYSFLERHKFYDLILSLIGFITLIASGSRGSFLLTSACILYFYVFYSKNLKLKIIRNVILFVVLVVAVLNINRVLGILSNLGFESRTINKILDFNFFSSESRDTLFDICQNYINDKPFGYGPLASRSLLEPLYPYPHSFFYEFQLDFGVFFGWILTIFTILVSVYLVFANRKNDLMLVVGIVCILGVMSLLISSSYYHEYYLPAAFALFINIFHLRRKKRCNLRQ